MTLPDLQNIIVFLSMGPFVILAQAAAPDSVVTTSPVQLGAVGVILGWLTMAHMPAMAKAAEKREEAAEKREGAWRASLEVQTIRAEAERARLAAEPEKTMTRAADALAALAASKADQSRTLGELADEIREDRARR